MEAGAHVYWLVCVLVDSLRQEVLFSQEELEASSLFL